MSFEIFKTSSIGFCFGVRRAVNALYDTVAKGHGRKIYTLGSIIHNAAINKDLQKRGVRIVDSVDEISPGSTVFIRTHGVGADVYARLSAAADADIVDMTCPKVKRIHSIAQSTDNLIVAGDAAHPEVIGIVGNAAGFCRVVKDENELRDFLSVDFDPHLKYVFVAQTTFNVERFMFMRSITDEYDNIEAVNTVCTATSERQKQVDILAREVDAMLIVGDPGSSNTRKLYEIASKYCEAYLISSAGELPKNLKKYKKIGLSAGASAPDEMIEEVIINMMNENDEKVLTEDDIDFAAAIDASMKIIRNGQRVTGVVTGINNTEVQIDLGAKHSGFIPKEEFDADEEPVKVGDEVEAIVVKVNDSEGVVQLSKSRIDAIKGFETLSQAKETGEICTGKVMQVVKGGLIVSVNRTRVFVPASQAALTRNADLNAMVGSEVRLRIIEAEMKGRNSRIIGSIRSVLKEEKEAKAKAVRESLEVGKKFTGTVKSLTNFGAFVDIGGVDGLVHVTDLAWGKVKNPADVVSVGDVVEVEVKSFDPETGKISLVYKKQEDNPWNILSAKYSVGDIIDSKVLKIMPYGAFVSVIPGIDGLVHISQIADRRIDKVSDVLTAGQTIKAKIINIDYDNKKVSLSVKDASDDIDDAEQDNGGSEPEAE